MQGFINESRFKLGEQSAKNKITLYIIDGLSLWFIFLNILIPLKYKKDMQIYGVSCKKKT